MGNLDDASKMQMLMEEYKIVINTQMHFNDMLMKMRAAVFSVVIAIFGGAGAVLGQYPDRFISIWRLDVHIAAPVILFGLVLLLAIYMLDHKYYYKMLLGAVERGYEFDQKFKDEVFYQGFHLFGMSEKIRDHIGKPGKSETLLRWFYGIIGIVGILYFIIILICIGPTPIG